MSITFQDWHNWTNDEGIPTYTLDWSSPEAMKHYPPRAIVEALRQAILERCFALATCGYPQLPPYWIRNQFQQNQPVVSGFAESMGEFLLGMIPKFLDFRKESLWSDRNVDDSEFDCWTLETLGDYLGFDVSSVGGPVESGISFSEWGYRMAQIINQLKWSVMSLKGVNANIVDDGGTMLQGKERLAEFLMLGVHYSYGWDYFVIIWKGTGIPRRQRAYTLLEHSEWEHYLEPNGVFSPEYNPYWEAVVQAWLVDADLWQEIKVPTFSSQYPDKYISNNPIDPASMEPAIVNLWKETAEVDSYQHYFESDDYRKPVEGSQPFRGAGFKQRHSCWRNLTKGGRGRSIPVRYFRIHQERHTLKYPAIVSEIGSHISNETGLSGYHVDVYSTFLEQDTWEFEQPGTFEAEGLRREVLDKPLTKEYMNPGKIQKINTVAVDDFVEIGWVPLATSTDKPKFPDLPGGYSWSFNGYLDFIAYFAPPVSVAKFDGAGGFTFVT